MRKRAATRPMSGRGQDIKNQERGERNGYREVGSVP